MKNLILIVILSIACYSPKGFGQHVDVVGDAYITGDLGVGTTTPASKMQVGDHTVAGQVFLTVATASTSISGIKLRHVNDDFGFTIESNDIFPSQGFHIRRHVGSAFGVSDLFIGLSGNVGIGVTDPDAKLEVDGQIKITGGSPGADKVLVSDADGLAAWSDIKLDTDLGIGTTMPESEVHIQGKDQHSQLILEPIGSTNDTSSIFLSEASNGDHGAIIMYDGVSNELQFQGKLNGINTGTHFQIERTDGNAGFGGISSGNKLNVEGNTRISEFTQLGDDAPKIKMKKLTGTTSHLMNGLTNVIHGLDPLKILAFDVLVNGAVQPRRIPPGFTAEPGHEYNAVLNINEVELRLSSSNSSAILSKPITILITYEE